MLALVALAVCTACGSASARMPLERAAGTVPPTTTTTAPPVPTTPPPPPTTLAPANAVMSPRGFALPVDQSGPDAWTVETPCGNKTTLAAGTPLATPTVVLDPGHGGG